MALVIKDRVRQTSTTAGTGTITLSGSVTGFQDFTVIGTGNTTYYTIADQSGANWEVGLGTYTAPNQLSRDTVYESSNSNNLVNFGSNIKDVFVTLPAEGFASPPAIGGTTPNAITGTTVTANTDIKLPERINLGNDIYGVIQMQDGGDGYDYLNIYGADIYSNVYPVAFPGGLSITGGVLTINTTATAIGYVSYGDGTLSGFIRLYDSTNTESIKIQSSTSLASSFTLTLPTSAGSNNQVLKTDGSGNLSWLDFGSPPAIGNTTPNSGAFTTITRTGAETITAITDPSAPSNGNVAFYAKTFGGYPTLAARNALNTPFGLQSALWNKNFYLWTNATSTNGFWLGVGGTGNGTFAIVSPTVGATKYQTIKRSTYSNVITTTNQILGVTAAQTGFFRGSVAGQGGFFYHARCGFDVWTNGGRFFAGLSVATTVASADPSTVNQTVGFCVDAADNGAISFLTRGTAATKASTGYTITSNKGYDLYIYCSPNSSQYTWQIVDINAGTSASGTATANLPTNTQLQYPYVLASNAALTPANSITLGVAKIYVESDY